jgi:hypothetical protein
VVKNIFGPGREEIIGLYRKLQNERFLSQFAGLAFTKYEQDNSIKESKMDGAYSTHRRDENYINIFVGRP